VGTLHVDRLFTGRVATITGSARARKLRTAMKTRNLLGLELSKVAEQIRSVQCATTGLLIAALYNEEMKICLG
jgi:hypothetical protein